MANFQNNAITESGILLRSHVDMGAVFTATKIVIGSGYIPTGKTAKTMTDVVSPVKELVINKKERSPDGKVIFGGVYTNEDITTEFYFRELALYAKAVYPDGMEVAEVLYSYGNAADGAELMAAYSTSTVVERQMDIVTFVGNEAQVDLTIESGAYVTAENLARVAAPAPPTSGIDLYVSPDGNDSTGDGTEAKPFRQIQKAINSLPKDLGGQTARIFVASGEYTSVSVEGFYGGNQSGGPNLRINSAGTDRIVINGYIRIRGCDAQISFGKATVRGSAAGYDVIAYGCKFVALVGLNCADTSAAKGIVVDTCSYVMVNGCTLSNKEIALEAYGSTVMAHTLKGVNNACAIKSGNSDAGLAALVYVAYRSITATTLYTKVNGGLIFENGNEIDAFSISGGILNGNLMFSGSDPIICSAKGQSGTRIRIYSGEQGNFDGGASINLYQSNHGTSAGHFSIAAHDGTNSSALSGSPSGNLTWNGKGIYHEGKKPSAADVDAVAKTGDQTMSGSLTGRAFLVSDGYMKGDYGVDGALKRVEIRAIDPSNGAMGALLVNPSGLLFMDGGGYEYRVVHEGNIGQFLGVAPATVE